MKRVGLCGTIGSGKSTVCRMLAEEYSVPVYIADDRAKRLMTESAELVERISAAFGSECYADGELNRGYLAAQIFSSEEKRLQLNSIVHPAVCRDFVEWSERQQAEYVVVESAILFESGLDSVVDATVAVVAPESLALERAAVRDSADIEAVKARMAVQCSAEELRNLVDFVVENIDIADLYKQVCELDGKLREL